jgi:hypothetical protein
VADIGAFQPNAEDIQPVVELIQAYIILPHGSQTKASKNVKMLRHVSLQNHLNDDLPAIAPLVLTQWLKDVTVCLLQDLVRQGAVHILQHGLVVIPQGQFIPTHNQIPVCQRLVPYIVRAGSDYGRKHLNQQHMLFQLRVLHKV